MRVIIIIFLLVNCSCFAQSQFETVNQPIIPSVKLRIGPVIGNQTNYFYSYQINSIGYLPNIDFNSVFSNNFKYGLNLEYNFRDVQNSEVWKSDFINLINLQLSYEKKEIDNVFSIGQLPTMTDSDTNQRHSKLSNVENYNIFRIDMLLKKYLYKDFTVFLGPGISLFKDSKLSNRISMINPLSDEKYLADDKLNLSENAKEIIIDDIETNYEIAYSLSLGFSYDLMLQNPYYSVGGYTYMNHEYGLHLSDIKASFYILGNYQFHKINDRKLFNIELGVNVLFPILTTY